MLISLHRLRPRGPPCGLRESRKGLRARLEEWVEKRSRELQQLFGEFGLGVDARKSMRKLCAAVGVPALVFSEVSGLHVVKC
ncbi:MAG: hypothetical protein QXQ60_03590 [Thermofilum sp.]